MESFGKRLQQALDDRNMKQIDLANATGFSKARISQWVHDKYIPNAEGLNKIAKALNVSETWLMGHDVPQTYDRDKLELGYQICNLFQKCYGKESYKVVHNFLQLDDFDQQIISTMINQLLQNDKYSIKKESSNDQAM